MHDRGQRGRHERSPCAGTSWRADERLPPSGAAAGHLGFLEGVRGLAALYVVLHHIWITNYPQFPENSGPV
jgi:hypothetical protein